MTRSVISLVLDALCVLVFVIVGLSQHGLAMNPAAVGWVAWPFLAALLLGHLATRSWQGPFRVWHQGVLIWAITVVGGMAVRSLLGMGTELSFVAVASIFLGLTLLGWRAIASFVTRRKQRDVISEAELRETHASMHASTRDE